MKIIFTFIVICFSISQIPNKLKAANQQDCIVVDESKIIIKQSGCNISNGSITNILVSGATRYEWVNESDVIIGYQIDLIDIPAGIYILNTYNDTGCEKSSSLINVPNGGGTPLPLYDVYGINTGCGGKNGSLHIEFKNLPKPQKIRWTDVSGTTISEDADVFGLDVGIYNLYLTDDEGCDILYRSAELRRGQDLNIDFQNAILINDTCNRGVGSIKGIKLLSGFGSFSVKWLNGKGETISNSLELINITQGDYTMEVIDGCSIEPLKYTYTIGNTDNDLIPPSVDDILICSPEIVTIETKNPKIGYYKLYDSYVSSDPILESEYPNFKISVTENISYYMSYSLGSCESNRVKFNIKIGISSSTIPNSFSPNNDGINDTWNLSWLYGYKNPIVKVYNRLGQLVYDYQRDKLMFNGYLNDKSLPIGTYYYIVKPGKDCNQINGTLTIIR